LKHTPVSLHLYFPEVDEAFQTADKAGAKVMLVPTEMSLGDRFAVVEDREGHRWSVPTHVRDLPPEQLNHQARDFIAQRAEIAQTAQRAKCRRGGGYPPFPTRGRAGDPARKKKTEPATLAASFFVGPCRAYSAGALTGADVWAAPPSFLKRWNSVAAIGPLMLCQTLKMALGTAARDRKSTRLNSSHVKNSYAVFCLKKK